MESTDELQIVRVNWSDRWQVYHRLQALNINCYCKFNQPLLAYADTPQAAIQVWSVVKQCTADRQELIDWLSQCWQIKSYK